MLFPFEQSKPTTPPKGSRKFLFKSRPRKRTRMLGFASRTPIATNRAMIGPQLRQSKQSIFTQRKVLCFSWFKRHEETLGSRQLKRGPTQFNNFPSQSLSASTTNKKSFFFGFHASENRFFCRVESGGVNMHGFFFFFGFVNDPSAGSPTETLLRLLLPLNDQVWSPSRLRVELPQHATVQRAH